jgi:beta-lactam-binding protein with PASTA domain
VRVVLVSDTAIVPEVTGKQANVADTLLKAAGFQVATVDTPTTDPPGLVLHQDPKAGARWPRSSPVRLLQVTGDVPIPPGLVGLTEGEARNRILTAGLVDSVIRTPQLTGAFGTVIAVDPATGKLPRAGKVKVTLLVEGRKVPDVRNQTWDQARPQVEARGLIARQETNWTQDENTVGRVSSLSPRQDSVVEVNTEVAVGVDRLCKAANLRICQVLLFRRPILKGLMFFKKDS